MRASPRIGPGHDRAGERLVEGDAARHLVRPAVEHLEHADPRASPQPRRRVHLVDAEADGGAAQDGVAVGRGLELVWQRPAREAVAVDDEAAAVRGEGRGRRLRELGVDAGGRSARAASPLARRHRPRRGAGRRPTSSCTRRPSRPAPSAPAPGPGTVPGRPRGGSPARPHGRRLPPAASANSSSVNQSVMRSSSPSQLLVVEQRAAPHVLRHGAGAVRDVQDDSWDGPRTQRPCRQVASGAARDTEGGGAAGGPAPLRLPTRLS